MKRLLISLAAACVLLLQSCIDAEPGEISVIATLDGQPKTCIVKVFNSNHKQIQEANTDNIGLVYIKQLAPGTYYLEFASTLGEPYPAKAEVEVRAGDSVQAKVELNEVPVDTSGGS
jgi:hypothetical protein